MSIFIVFMIIALIFFIIEIYTPTMLFLNFALAAAICSILGLFIHSFNILVPIFVVLSILFLLFLRPLFNINPNKDAEHTIDSPYIGKQATAITNINAFSGRVKVYDEDWEARTSSDDVPEIAKGAKVTIIRHDDLTMYVEQKTTAKKGKK